MRTFTKIVAVSALILAEASPSGTILRAGDSAPASGGRKSDSVVRIAANADKPDDSGRMRLTVELAIEPDWHVYAHSVGKDFSGVPTTVTVSARGQQLEAEIEYPAGTLVHDAYVGDYHVYEGATTIKAAVRRATGDSGPLEVAVKVQACSKQKCLLPATVKLRVP